MPSPPDLKSDDYYKNLGVDRSASDAEIAKAYKKLALKIHPDKNPDNKEEAEENFKVITEAYETLRDPDKRKVYDQVGKQGLQGGGGGGGGSGGVSFQQADEIFKQFFGGNDPFRTFFGGEDDDDGFGAFFGRGGMPGGMPGGPRVVFRSGGMPSGGRGMPGGSGGMDFFSFGGPGEPFGMGGGRGAGRGRGRPASQPPPAHAMANGTAVVVRGLKGSPEHNGKTGRTRGWDAGKGRYEVELDGETSLSLKPSNLTQQCTVRVVGIESQPELNGQSGTILNYQEEQGRYLVRLRAKMPNGRDTVGLQPANVILQTGTRVITQGLSNEQFNGQMAQILEIDQEASRYTVQCQNGKQIKIKFDNVLC